MLKGPPSPTPKFATLTEAFLSAGESPSGVTFVDLAPIVDPALVVRWLSAHLRRRPDDDPAVGPTVT